jgi:tetratricopeptide (TPR) repeat protein
LGSRAIAPQRWADELTRREIAITNQNNIALTHTQRGDRSRAAAMYDKALESAREYGFHRPSGDRRVNKLYADLLINAANTIRNHGPAQRQSAFAYTQELLRLLEQDQDPMQFAIRSRRCNALNTIGTT